MYDETGRGQEKAETLKKALHIRLFKEAQEKEARVVTHAAKVRQVRPD